MLTNPRNSFKNKVIIYLFSDKTKFDKQAKLHNRTLILLQNYIINTTRGEGIRELKPKKPQNPLCKAHLPTNPNKLN